MKSNVTPRQLEALEASYRAGNPHMRVGGPIGERKAFMDGARSRAGGSAGRMVADLQTYGYITRAPNWTVKLPAELKDDWGQLTVKGYDALAPHAEKLGIDPLELAKRRADRAAREEAIEQARVALREERSAKEQERAATARARTLNRAREIMTGEAIDLIDWNDERVLEFVDRIASI